MKSEQTAPTNTDGESSLSTKVRAEASGTRSMIATVLFFDVVGYTKQSVSRQIELKAQFNNLVSEFIEDIEENQRIILDTGDGAAIGFLQHPEDAIEVALKFRTAVATLKLGDYPDLKVRIGIHLGPVKIVKDMNGQSNMVGDGINDAERIMSFAASGQIYISRSYYDIVSRLSAEYASLFQYRGIKNDKHGRQHQVYEAVVEKTELAGLTKDVVQPEEQSESAPFSIQLEPFLLDVSGQNSTTAPAQLTGERTRILDITTAPQAVKESSVSLQEIQLNFSSEEILAEDEHAAIAQDRALVIPHEIFEAPKVVQKTRQELEAEAQALAEQQEREATEALRIKAEQAYAMAMAEKEAQQMAEEQAKVWAEAEQRAKALAITQIQVEQAAPQADKTHPAKSDYPSIRTRRKPLPLGTIATGLFILLLAMIAALPYVWPMPGYLRQLENKLSAQLHQPVHIAHLKAGWLPLPHLELQDVSIGSEQELKAASVILNFDITALLSEIKAIKNVEINDLALNADSFMQELLWLQTAGGDAHYPISNLILKRAHINGEGLSLPPLNGKADWDAQGHFSKALLRSDDNKIDMELQPQQPHWQIALHIKESSLPGLPTLMFNELNTRGEIGENSADFTDLDGHLYGGNLTGSAHLSWQNDWQMQGRVNVKAMNLQEALPRFGIEGEMDGDSSFILNGPTLPQLANAPHLDGTFMIKKGIINKLDLMGSAANHHSTAGGRTHFDALSGTLLTENNSQYLSQLKISGGIMSANGSVDISPTGRLSGRLSVEFKMRSGSTTLALDGKLTEPTLRPAY